MTEFIKYKDKDYPVKMGYYALKHTSREMKAKNKDELTMDNLSDSDIETLEPMLFYSLKMGAHLENETLDLKREDMEFMLDEVMNEFVAIISKMKVDEDLAGKLPVVKKNSTKKPSRTNQ